MVWSLAWREGQQRPSPTPTQVWKAQLSYGAQDAHRTKDEGAG